MLRFDIHRGDGGELDLSGAYVFGQDAIPVRADIAASDSRITCIKRMPGAVGLALLWNSGEPGVYLLPTARLQERAKPYNLNVELARAQMMRISQKREDWGLFDYSGAEALNRQYESARADFVASLKPSDESDAAALADKALAQSMVLGERMALFHADVLLGRRRASGTARTGFGCMVDLLSTAEDYSDRLREAFDHISVPTPWKQIEPKEHQYNLAQIDTWINWAARTRKPVHAGPLLSFEPRELPEWFFLWEHDYDALRAMMYEHIQRVVKRYEKHVSVWNVVSGIHAYNCFNLTFEQIMELTRMACLLVKRLAPRAQAMIDLVTPWGEYYARNQKTIPPLLYADMAVQSGIKFDSFGARVCMGVPVDGLYIRDLMQISSLLDEFVGLGKPVHITAAQVPSDTSPDAWDAWGGKSSVEKAGQWHAPWSPRLQAEWLQAFSRIAASRPFVESICWRDLADYEGHFLPHGGLCHNNMQEKLSYRELRNFRSSLSSQAVVIDQQRPGHNGENHGGPGAR